MKSIFVLLLVNLFISATQAQAPAAPQAQAPATAVVAQAPAVLSFLEWKSMRVHEAQQKLEAMGKGSAAQGTIWQEGKSEGAEDTSTRLKDPKLNFNVDVALQLNVQDYFSMYLKTLNSEEFKEASKKLTEEEKTELLLAYKNSLDKEKKLPLKLSKNPKDNAKSKNTEIQ
jgi:hypothetical protein